MADLHHTRVHDYLNDKLQTYADFDTLDTLLAGVVEQHKLLEQQRHAHAAADDHRSKTADIARKAHAFRSAQADIDRRIAAVTGAATSDDAVEQFAPAIDHLRRLDIADGYLAMLADMEALSTEASTLVATDPDAAVDAYARLRAFQSTLNGLHAEAESAAPHLIDHLDQTLQRLRKELVEALGAELEKVLHKFLWPKPDVSVPNAVQLEFQKACGRLLELEKAELLAPLPSHDAALLPLQIMVKPLETRFNFHFTGDKRTNRTDKPEWFLSHVLDLVAAYSPFVNQHVQPALLEHFRGTALLANPLYIDATSALVSALLPVLKARVLSHANKVAGDPQLLSHLMRELMTFDSALRAEWHYGAGAEAPWQGLAGHLLSTSDWFDKWLRVEESFALSRYQAIVDAPDSSEIDFDSLDSTATKPTKAAIRVNDLLEAVTDHYRPLVSFAHKLRFLIDIQINIFDRFHARLRASLDQFVARSSAVGRTVQGVSPDEALKLRGVPGLDLVCRVVGSADFLERAVQDWSDDVFFFELWTELQDRAAGAGQLGRGTGASAKVAGHMSLSDVAARTSSTLRGDADAAPASQGGLFDEVAAAYAGLRSRGEALLVETLSPGLAESLRAYARSTPWATMAATATDASGTLLSSAELAPALAYLDAAFAFLALALGTLALARAARSIAHVLDAYLFDRVLMGNTFSAAGAAQVRKDAASLAAVLDRHAGSAVGSRAMRRAGEACQVLGLAAERDNGQAGQAGQADGAALDTPGALGLYEVDRRLAGADDADAADVLAELGVAALSPHEARELLRRRVEMAGV